MLSNDQNPLYNKEGLSQDAQDFVEKGGIWPFDFITAIVYGSARYKKLEFTHPRYKDHRNTCHFALEDSR